jgi:hypothetical protein
MHNLRLGAEGGFEDENSCRFLRLYNKETPWVYAFLVGFYGNSLQEI